MFSFKQVIGLISTYAVFVFGATLLMANVANGSIQEPSKVNVIIWVDVPKTRIMTSMTVNSIEECIELIYLMAVKEKNGTLTMKYSFCYEVNNPSILYGYKTDKPVIWPEMSEYKFGQVKQITFPD